MEGALISALDVLVKDGDRLAPIFPQVYQSETGPIVYPDLTSYTDLQFSFESEPVPRWSWRFSDGELSLAIQPASSGNEGGIALLFQWLPSASSRRTKKDAAPKRFQIRPLGSFRPLHAVGGRAWDWAMPQAPAESSETPALIALQARGEPAPQGYAKLIASGGASFEWVASESWYHRFHYSEERERGYDSQEDLYSPGFIEASFSGKGAVSLLLAEKSESLLAKSALKAPAAGKTAKAPLLDFTLHEPAGIVAGYPWFGEWGRDTFVSLPGIAAFMAREKTKGAKDWVFTLLEHWGKWIESNGMLPNLLERDGKPQWESSDATLWWTHSLASIWSLSLGSQNPQKDTYKGLEKKFTPLLRAALESIRSGRHRFLNLRDDGLLDVTEAHSTWMDARVWGYAVTPRRGVLPEINALWFQALLLDWIWRGGPTAEFEDLGRLARLILDVSLDDEDEAMRPNRVFLHSLPLAPSFVLEDWESLGQGLMTLAEDLWTPVGLRSLSPKSPGFRPRCAGTQEERDSAYHQGSVWGWLGGHYEMARARLPQAEQASAREANVSDDERRPTFDEATLASMPIRGHIPEIFDAISPFTPRGAPAQAWSLACLEEARERSRLQIDAALRGALASSFEQSGAARIRGLAKRNL